MPDQQKGDPAATDSVAEKPKKGWNSLEIAKLVVGASTPLAIFALGMFFTLSSKEEAAKREDSIIANANNRQDAAATASERRENAARDQARQDTTAAAAQANERERAQRADANAFQIAQTSAANQRDDALRRLAEGERQRARIFEIRLRGWEAASEALADAHDQMTTLGIEIGPQLGENRPFNVTPERIVSIRSLIMRGTYAIRRYESFYSERFFAAANLYNTTALYVVAQIGACSQGFICSHPGIIAAMLDENACYQSLQALARGELGDTIVAARPIVSMNRAVCNSNFEIYRFRVGG